MGSFRRAAACTLLLATSCATSSAATEEPGGPTVLRRIVGSGDRSCGAYLVLPDAGAAGAPVVLAMRGTGEYTMDGAWERDPFARVALDGGAAWLAFDKPGIVADAGAPGGFRAEPVYDDYAPRDLVACAHAALAWASEAAQAGDGSPIVIQGHSEGAIVAGELLLRLHETEPARAARVSALLLSGTPAGGMRDVLARQFERVPGRAEAYERAMAAGDDAFVRKHAGVGADTLRALLDARPLHETFAALVPHRPAARIALFHGLEDENAPADMVRALVAENDARVAHAEPGLELAVRWYDAGHRLNLAAVHDINLWLLGALRRDGYLAGAEREVAAPAVEVAEESIAAAIGRYRIDERMTIELTREGSRLFAQATGQPRFPVYFAAEDRLETKVAPIALELVREGGRVPALILVQGGRHRCPRID